MLFAMVGPLTGQPLYPLRQVAQQDKAATRARTARIAPESLHRLIKLRPGDQIAIPLFEQEIARGTVNLA